jgi:hypothetical protein
MTPHILGLSGETITDDERALFREADPAGFILFKRNVANRAQLRALTDDLRALSGRPNGRPSRRARCSTGFTTSPRFRRSKPPGSTRSRSR